MAGDDVETEPIPIVKTAPPDEVATAADQLERLRKGAIAPLVQNCIELAGVVCGLTTKERTILPLILDGLANKEIGGRAGNTEKHIKHHVAAICRKFGVKSRTELFATMIGRR